METEALEVLSSVEETPLPTETPAAPEGVAPSAPADEAATTEPAAALAARPRGPDGRFIKADGTQASEAEHAALEAAAPPSPPPATTPPAPAAPSAVPGEPFVFRADGQKIPIPGSSVSPDGHLTIPVEQVPAIRQLLAEGVAHRGSWRQREQELQRQVQEAGAAGQARVQKYNEASVFLFDLISDPAKLQSLVENPERIELVRERLALMLQKHDLKAPQKPAPKAEPSPQDVQAQNAALERNARDTLEGYVEELLDTPQAKAVYNTPEKRQAVIKRYQRRLNAYFVEQQDGIALHENAVDDDFKEELQVQIEAQRASVKATEAAAFNARRNAPAPTAPPVVSTKGPSTNGSTNRPIYKTREEYRRAMGMN